MTLRLSIEDITGFNPNDTVKGIALYFCPFSAYSHSTFPSKSPSRFMK